MFIGIKCFACFISGFFPVSCFHHRKLPLPKFTGFLPFHLWISICILITVVIFESFSAYIFLTFIVDNFTTRAKFIVAEIIEGRVSNQVDCHQVQNNDLR